MEGTPWGAFSLIFSNVSKSDAYIVCIRMKKILSERWGIFGDWEAPALERKNFFRFKIFHACDAGEIARVVSDGIEPFPARM